MVCIITKFIPATDTKPTRIKAMRGDARPGIHFFMTRREAKEY